MGEAAEDVNALKAENERLRRDLENAVAASGDEAPCLRQKNRKALSGF